MRYIMVDGPRTEGASQIKIAAARDLAHIFNCCRCGQEAIVTKALAERATKFGVAVEREVLFACTVCALEDQQRQLEEGRSIMLADCTDPKIREEISKRVVGLN